MKKIFLAVILLQTSMSFGFMDEAAVMTVKTTDQQQVQVRLKDFLQAFKAEFESTNSMIRASKITPNSDGSVTFIAPQIAYKGILRDLSWDGSIYFCNLLGKKQVDYIDLGGIKENAKAIPGFRNTSMKPLVVINGQKETSITTSAQANSLSEITCK